MKDAIIIGKVDENSSSIIKKYQTEYQIIAFVDNNTNESGIRVNGVPVINMSIEAISVFAIVLDNDWDITVAKLIASGKKRHIDFECDWYFNCEDKNCIHTDLITKMSSKTAISVKHYVNWFAKGRKIASVFGNCQSYYVVDMLLRVDEFVQDYVIIKNYMIANCPKEIYRDGLNSEILNCIDVFFHQIISDNNKFSSKLSTNVINQHLKAECVSVSFPNSYFKGYWPQYTHQKNKSMVRTNGVSIVPYGDSVLDFVFSKNYRWEKIWGIINSSELFTKEYIENNVKDSLQELKSREFNTDIIISDYIEKYYKEKELFYSTNHPSNDVMKVITTRCLEKIGINIDNIDDTGIIPNDSNEILLYPIVKEVLKLQWDKKLYRFSKFIDGYYESTFYEYVFRYQQECFPDYQYNHQIIKVQEDIHIDSAIRLQEESLISINESICWINIKLECIKEGAINEMFSIPKEFAPMVSFYCMCQNLEENSCIPIIIEDTGICKCITGTSVNKGDVLYINTGYHLK